MKFRLVTVIWGADFVDMFLRVGLRSLLAEGNLPDLAKAHQVTYTIFTTPEDAQVIEAHAAFSHLRAVVDVQFSIFTKREIDSGNYGSHNILWERGLDLARRNREILFFIIPDLLYAGGTLLHWAAKFVEGYRAIYTPGPQVVLETIVPEIEERFPSPSEPISIGQEEVAPLMLRHLHPLHCGVLRDTPYRVSFPEYDIRAVSQRGIVLREITAQPFCVDPNYFARLVNFSPIDDLDAIAVEPCMTLSVEPLCKRAEWSYRPWRLDDVRISQLASFVNFFSPPGCFHDSATAHRIGVVDDETWRRESARAVAGGRLFRAALVAGLHIYRLIVGLQKHNLRGAAGIIAGAVYAAKLRRRSGLCGGETLLIPNDTAISNAANLMGDLFTPGREKELVALMRDHVLSVGSLAQGRAVVTARGLPFAEIADQANIVSGPYQIESFTIYVIDSVLWREKPVDKEAQAMQAPIAPFEAEASPEKKPLSVEYASPVTQGYVAQPNRSIGGKLTGVWGYPASTAGSTRRRIFYVGLYVPGIEFILRLFAEIHPRERARGFARFILRHGSGVYTRAFRMLFRSERSARADAQAVLRRARKYARIPVKVAERLPILRHAVPTTRLAVRAVRFTRVHGLRAASIRINDSVRDRIIVSRLVPADTIPETAAKKLDEVRLLRSLKAIENVIDYYARVSLPAEIASAPLDLIRDILRRNDLDGEKALQAVEIALESLADEHPDCADVWLELGHLRFDQERFDEAKACYLNASEMRVFAQTPQDKVTHPAIQARIALARILAARGERDAACREYEKISALVPEHSMAQIEYALLLRETGQTARSLIHFVSGIQFDWPHWHVPKAGRDATKLRFPVIGTASAADFALTAAE